MDAYVDAMVLTVFFVDFAASFILTVVLATLVVVSSDLVALAIAVVPFIWATWESFIKILYSGCVSFINGGGGDDDFSETEDFLG